MAKKKKKMAKLQDFLSARKKEQRPSRLVARNWILPLNKKKGYSNFKLNVNVNVVVIVVVIDVTVVAVIVIDVLAKIMLTLTTMCIVAAGSATARRNIDAGLKSLRKAGADPASDHCCIDIGAGKKFAVVSVGRVLTLTASRCSARAWWLTKASSSVQNES